MKIILSVATKCQILTLKCTKLDFGWGTAPDPGELTALPWPPSWWEGDWLSRAQCCETAKYVLIRPHCTSKYAH